MTIRATIEIALDTTSAFDTLVNELVTALRHRGMRFDPTPTGRVTEDDVEVGRVVSWEPGRQIELEWRPADWMPEQVAHVECRFEPVQEGTRVTLEIRDWGAVLGDDGSELMGWFTGEVASSLLHGLAPKRLGDWITDRRARRPSGALARSGYRDPVYHRPNFKAILKELALTREDYLLEVGCGGGAFLEDALRSGCRAAAIDHSPEMANVAREVNKDAVRDRRLDVSEAEADKLPYPNSTFTCAVMTSVFGLVPDPVACLGEIHRVLRKEGRIVIFVLAREMGGTPAAPEPVASRARFYEDDELQQLLTGSGFVDVRVERPSLEPFAREAGLPEEEAKLFAGHGWQLVVARKGRSPTREPRRANPSIRGNLD